MHTIVTTFALLKENGFGIADYNKLAITLLGKTPSKKGYILLSDSEMDVEVSLSQILDIVSLDACIDAFQLTKSNSNRIAHKAALEIAKSCLCLYESVFPEDFRIRKALSETENYLNFLSNDMKLYIAMKEARNAWDESPYDLPIATSVAWMAFRVAAHSSAEPGFNLLRCIADTQKRIMQNSYIDIQTRILKNIVKS